MNQSNHTSPLATIFSRRLLRLRAFLSQRGRPWLRLLISVLLLSSLLLNPLDTTSAYALAVPTQIAPIDGSTITADPGDTPPLGIPEFQWTAVAGATSYRLQVSNNIGFTTTILNITTPNTTYSPTSAAPFSDGTWYWRVQAETPAPVSGFSDPPWSFTKQWATPANAPALIAPLDLDTIDFYDDPVFSWGPVMGAAEYNIRIYSSSGACLSSPNTATTLATTYQPAAKLANGNYFWCVLPVDPGNHVGTPSQERSFTAGYNFVPTLLAPDDNATPTFTPTFRWTAVRGAQYYTLQYCTDLDASFSPGNTTTVTTRNTTYTPLVAMPNDKNYFWRVKVQSGLSISNWSVIRQFQKQWYIKPVLLTPVDGYQHQRFPLYSWTPVPGASYYKIEISAFSGFSILFNTDTTANTFYTATNHAPGLWYWRVTPYDGDGNAGKTSDTSSYVSDYAALAPNQVYPLYYYLPDAYVNFPGVTTNPHEDRTAPLPIFIWNRIYKPAGDPDQGQVYADAYRLQVSTDINFGSWNWSVDTENTTAAPTTANPFAPLPNTNYYWRVRPLIGGSEVGDWSQTWKARFDLSQGLASTAGPSPTLIRPTTGFEYAEATPLLEWFPLNGASSYDVEISLDSSFGSTVDTATVPYPAYAPTQSLAQRSLERLNFGVYYWRVRQSGSSTWSEIRRFQISAQSQWQYTRVLGAAANQLQIGSDPVVGAGDVTTDADYDVTSLQAAQDKNFWYFGFHVPSSPTKDVTYALYLDLDHIAGSGATSDASGYSVTTIPAFRPEYAVYVVQTGGVYAANQVLLRKWNALNGNWDALVNHLDNVGGFLNQTGNYIEIKVPNTSIGYQDTTGSYAISLVSLPAGGSGAPQDSVPSDPNVPGSAPISRFANVTERMNLVMPPNNAGVDSTIYPSVLPFFWDWPVLAPWSGALMEARLDAGFTSPIQGDYILTAASAYAARTSHAWNQDFTGDNTYFWRIRPRYRNGGNLYLGAWSQGWSFERRGFIPQNLQTSVTFATPTFSWDMLEGAESYDLQVDNDSSFGSTVISINTKQNSYTDTSTLPNAFYYWRVRAHRKGNVVNNWTSNYTFNLQLPAPAGMSHTPPGVVGSAPTLCWTPLIQNSPSTGEPVLAAWKYRVQVSKDTTFSSIFDTVDTEQSCWTPTKGYDDGTYYWHVAMIDGNARLGAYTANQTFTKQYPVTTLVSPLSGAGLASTPTFAWTPVDGAAGYRLQVSQFATFSPIYNTISIDNNTRYTPTISYAIPKTYYWRVAIVDADGKLGPFVGATFILDLYPFKVYLPLIKR